MTMKLTTRDVSRFVGGQMEIQNTNEGYLYRGEIATIVVENNEILVRFAWLAKGEGFPPIPRNWVRHNVLDFVANLEIYSASDIGPGSEGGNRLCLQSEIIGETIVLFPPDGSKLDRAKVKGLEAVPA